MTTETEWNPDADTTLGELGLCGAEENACFPGCCKTDDPTKAERNVEALAAEIAAAVAKARETKTVEITDPHAGAVIEQLVNDMADIPAEIPEPTELDRLGAALSACRGILERGDGLLPVKSGTSEHWIRAAKLILEDGFITPTVPVEPKRTESILQEAERIVNGPRRESYGHPAINFARIAHLWNGYLAAKVEGLDGFTAVVLTPMDIAQMMIHLKQCRLIQSPHDREGHVDTAGYAQCSWIIAEHDVEAAIRLADEL